jgi:hypothetical protein
MKVLVIMPTLGTSTWLDESMGSVTRCLPGCTPVLVCPRGRVAELTRRLPAARIRAEEGSGLYAALNGCLSQETEWDAFTWLADDDRLEPGVVRSLERMNPDADRICYGRVGLVGSDGRNLGAVPVARNPKDIGTLIARGIVPFAQPGSLIGRKAFELVGAFDESFRLAGDLDWFVRAVIARVPFVYCNDRVADFRLRSGQLSKDEATSAAEFERATAPLLPKAHRRPGATLRFRVSNIATYWQRLRLHGLVRMRDVYRKG